MKSLDSSATNRLVSVPSATAGAHELREQANLFYDGEIPYDVEQQIRAAATVERRAGEDAALMALPACERFDALARREWVAMRLIWRCGYLNDLRNYRHTRDAAYFRHVWKRNRDACMPHLIAWAAFRDAHRKLPAYTPAVSERGLLLNEVA
jgi:hypothetical protein